MPLKEPGGSGLDLLAGDRLRVSVPASTSNLGPAMDGLGMSVPLRLEVEVDATPPPSVQADAPAGTDLLQDVLRECAPGLSPEWARVTSNAIPIERGLGGSGAVRLAALLIGAAVAGGGPSTREILERATALEGHPDNVTSSMLGGVVASMVEDDGSIQWVELAPLERLEIVAVVPSLRISTELARGILPDTVPHADARYAAAHSALLVAAIAAGRYDVLADATRDRIHQPYRLRLIPGAADALAAGLRAGATCSFLSGSGSTLTALAELGRGAEVSAGIVAELDRAGTDAQAFVLAADGRGAEVEAIRSDGSTWSWNWGRP
jgi:homoserine kinase